MGAESHAVAVDGIPAGTWARLFAGVAAAGGIAQSALEVEMAYQLHIVRDQSLTLDEWISAVQATPALRLDDSAQSAINPNTGEVISVGGREGDVAISLQGKWVKVFNWRNGDVSFPVRGDLSRNDPVAMAAFALARHLGAVIRGDEGEHYEEPL